MTLKKYIRKFVFFRILFLILRYFFTCINTVVGAFIFSVLIDKILPLPIIFFHIYWFLIVTSLLIFFTNLVYRIIEVVNYPYIHLRDELVKRGRLQRKDDIINAYLLEYKILDEKNINFSKELAEKFVEEIKDLLFSVNFQEIVGFDKIKKVIPVNIVLIALFYILYSLPPYVIKTNIHKIIFTRNESILGIFILPKNIRVPYKSSVEIKVIVEKEYLFYTPELFVKIGDGKRFNKLNFSDVNNISNRKVYIYRIDSVEQPVFYKIKFRNVSSKVYVIEPILYPEISEVNIRVIPPDYTKIHPYEIESFTEGRYLYGSVISFKCKVNKQIKKVTMNIYGKNKELTISDSKDLFLGEFTATKNTELWFEIYDEDGLYNESIRYNINVIEDKSPEIEIISPQEDVVVPINSKVPLIYSVKDDISVTKVHIIYKIKNKENNSVIKIYDKKTTESIEEYLFDLSKLNLNFGDIITYSLVVYDNDTISGPKYDITPEYKIEIFSYEKKHQDIQKEVDKFINKVLDSLSKETELYDELINPTTPQLDRLILQHKNMNKDFEDLYKMLSSILDEMFSDPYTSMDTYVELKSLSSSIESLSKKLNPDLIDNLQNNKIKSALDLQENIIDTLERAAALTKEIMKKQNMNNVSNSLNDSVSKTKDLLDTLDSLSNKISPEDKIKILNLLKEIEEKISKIAELIKSMPQDLPEEFINRRDIKNIDFVTPTDLLKDIHDAILQGNISAAISAAKQFLSQLEEMYKTISSASSSLMEFSISKLNQKLDSILNTIDELIQQQQKIYQDTKELDEFRISELIKQQEELLKIMIEKINLIIYEINIILVSEELKKIPTNDVYRLNSSIVISNLTNVLSELKQKRLIQTPTIIKDAIKLWGKNLDIVKNYSNNYEFVKLTSDTFKVYEMLKEIDNLVNFQPSVEYPEKIVTRSKNIHNDQKDTLNKTDDLIKDMQSLGKESFIITSNDLNTANLAKLVMEQSSFSLEKLDFPNAIQSQNSAINLLSELKNNFVGKQKQLQQMMQQAGKPMSSGIQLKTSASGRFGTLTGRVLLPSVKDYVPPKELREDIIKSLSEKYPEELQKVIENYYREFLK